MKRTYKRFLSGLLVLALLAAFLPAGSILAAQPEADLPEETVTLTDGDYAQVDALFDRLSDMENEPAKKNANQSELTAAAEAIVTASDSYVEGSLVRNGESFTWETDAGIRCVYSPRLRKINAEMTAPAEPMADGVYNEPVTTKGGWPSGNQVYLVGPYYGYDSDFTDQYKNEAKAIASAIDDTDGYTLYSGKSATVDKVAEAVSKGAVVIFDSHGTTDYESGYDYVTGATSSYLCLTSTTGLTTQDYNDGALYYSDGICINGATIANHMTSNSPGGILWMAICLGMATNTMCDPLQAKGVEVVCGYSQSVTFDGDYLFAETFWDNMCAGATVAQASAAMKSKWGNWDWSTKIASYYGYSDGYSTIANARADYAAFPVVVSDEDTHPGQRNKNTFYGADSLQTVKSTYTLFSQYEVTARVNNSAWGSVAVNGNTITATLAAGYFAQGYTLVSGSATVSQNGNTFVVNAQSDCVVQINFAAKTSVSVSFSGANAASQTGYAGDAMTLPTVAAPEGFTFLGWMDEPLSTNTTEKPTYHTASIVPTGNTTLYALYSFVEKDSGTGSGDYVKVTQTPGDWSGEYLIVYESDELVLDSSLSTMDAAGNYQLVTITDGTIPAAQGDAYKVIIESMAGGGYSIRGVNGLYIGCTSNANKLNTDTAPLQNSLSMDASGNVNIVGSGGAYLRFNVSGDRFRYYKSGSYYNQEAIALYVKDGTAGTTWYTGVAAVCQHPNSEAVAAVAPNCTAGGFTAGVYCADCNSFISGHEPVEALGHSYVTVVTPPTTTEQGYTVYTCSRCGDSYTGDYVEALGQIFNVSFVVPKGVNAVADMDCGKSGITLPTAGVPVGEYSYVFRGWTTGRVDNATEEPVIYSGSFKATEDTTLYAVYSYVVGGTGTAEYVLTDLADIKSTDTVVITMNYNGTVYALTSANGSSKAPTGVIVEVTGDRLAAAPAAALKWNIGGTAGAYILYPAGQTATWLYCTSTNNGVRVGTGSNKTFSIDSDYLYNDGTGRYIGVYRTNPDWRCYTTINSNIVDQTLGFYVQGQPGTTYYTTEFAVACDHEEVTYSFADNTHVFTCTTCGQVAFTKAAASSAEKFGLKGASPVLSDDIVMVYETYIPTGFENAYMVFEFNGTTTTVTESTYNASNGRTNFRFPGLNPQKMGDNIHATLYATVDGYEVSIVNDYSMVQYCDRQLKNASTSAALRTALSDLLVYGKMNQIYEGYKTDALCTDLLSANAVMTPSTFPGVDASWNVQGMSGTKLEDCTFTGVDVTLGAKIVIGVKVTCVDTERFSFKVNIGGVDHVITGDMLEPTGVANKYVLKFDKITAVQLGETITFSIWEGDTQVSRSATYSVYSYIYKNQNSADTNLANLLHAIYNYGEAVKKIG